MRLSLTESCHDHSVVILLDVAYPLCLGDSQISNCDGPSWRFGFACSGQKATAKDRHVQ